MLFALSTITLLLFYVCKLANGQNPEITENILPEIKRVGVTGRLICVVINQLENPVQWIHKNTQMLLSSNDKIEVDEVHNTIVNGYPKYQIQRREDGEKITYTIIVNRLEYRDSGPYTCQILVRGSDRIPSKDGDMVVLVPPSIMMSSTTHAVSVREGESVNLTCEATGYPPPNTTWVRVNAALLPSGELRHQSRYLTLIDVKRDDRGIFRCLADNNVRPPSHFDSTLHVIYSPAARAVQTSYGQAENRRLDLTIECRIAGWPEPNLQWYKQLDGGAWTPINTDQKHTINILLNHANILAPNERWFQMVIRSVQANDYGYYICEGKNSIGAGHATVHVFATSECQGPNCPPQNVKDSAWGLRSRTFLVLFLIYTARFIVTR